MKVRFTRPAEADLEEIIQAIAEEDPDRAAELLDQLEDAAEELSEFPERCPVVEGTSLNGVRKSVRPYLLFYRLVPGEVQILRLAHERSDWVAVVARL